MNNESKKIYKDLGDESYSRYYFEQYKQYLDGIEKISDRRENANKYFLALNAGVVGVAGFLFKQIQSPDLLEGLLFVISSLGVVFSVIFWLLINSYKQLNSAKFKILHDIEQALPLQLYSREWEMLGRGKDHKKYFPFSHIERRIPVFFGIAYTLVLVWLLFGCGI